MSKEFDHHYVPQFHLRMWEDADHKLVQWGRIHHNNKLRRQPVTTAETAYKPGLYTLEHVLPEESQQIENKVFGKIETEASAILKKLVQGKKVLSVKERYWWTMYLNASVFRVPHVIARLRSEAQQIVADVLSKPSAEFDALKGDAPEATLLEWASNNHPARLANSGMDVLLKLLGNERAIDRIIHLRWMVRDVSSSSRTLLLGDDPFLRVNDLYKPRTLISIPLSPTHAFFGTDAADIADNVMNLGAREVVNRLNVETVRKAKRFVYGAAERSFIEKHLPLFNKSPTS